MLERPDFDLIPWALCVTASLKEGDWWSPDLSYYTSCGELYGETDSFSELSKDGDYCALDSRYCSGGIYAAYNLVVFNAGNYCYASEKDCCEINAGALSGIIIACIVALVLSIIACAWCCKCCCFKRKELAAQQGVMMQPAYVMPK